MWEQHVGGLGEWQLLEKGCLGVTVGSDHAVFSPHPPVCADNNHVRTWSVTRFRGTISTQPGSTPLASFKILALESADGQGGCSAGNDIGASAYLGSTLNSEAPFATHVPPAQPPPTYHEGPNPPIHSCPCPCPPAPL